MDCENCVENGLSRTSLTEFKSWQRTFFIENIAYLISIWANENRQSFGENFLWCNRKDVVLTLETMQKLIEFYYSKGIDTFNLRSTLPNSAIVCLHKSATFQNSSSGETVNLFLENLRENMYGWTSIVFISKAVMDETFMQNRQLCVSPLIVLVLFNFISNQGVNQSRLVYILDRKRQYERVLHHTRKQITLFYASTRL